MCRNPSSFPYNRLFLSWDQSEPHLNPFHRASGVDQRGSPQGHFKGDRLYSFKGISQFSEKIEKNTFFLKFFKKLEIFLKRNSSYISSILSTFKDYGISKSEEIRRNFSYNLPAILFLIDSKQFENYRTIYLNHLLVEKSFEVRITAVSSLKEILKIIGFEEAHKTFKDVMKSLFKEGNNMILKKIVMNLNEILEAFFCEDCEGNEEYRGNLQEFLGFIVALGYKLHKENQWREQNALLGELLK